MIFDKSKNPSPKSIIAFGDSNTTNANWESNRYPQNTKWVERLRVKVSPILGIDKGIGGNTTLDGLRRMENDVLNLNPDIVLIMFGTNDAVIGENGQPKVDPAVFQHNLQVFITAIKAIEATPMFMTTIPLIEGNGSDGFYYSRHPRGNYTGVGGARAWLHRYNQITRQIAKGKGVTLIDHWKNFVHIAGGEDDRALIRSGLFDPSGTHMTPKGAEAIILNICRVLKIVEH